MLLLLSAKAKEVFSCILGEKRAKYSEIGLRSGRSASPEPDFLHSDPEISYQFVLYGWNIQRERTGHNHSTGIVGHPKLMDDRSH
jgi:hypothetical protein